MVEPSGWLKQIGEKYSPKELEALARGALPQADFVRPIHNFEGEWVKVGVLSDTHLGSKYSNPDYVKMAFDEFDKAGVNFVTHSGDVVEGVSNRAGHVYECTTFGYDAQKALAIETMGQWDKTPIYMIDGNHDRWFMKSAGAIVVKDICDAIPNAEYLGEDEGDIQLNKNTKLKLWHGLDGAAYAISYRLQKIVESLTGGEKPDAIIAGHDHKSSQFMIRHVHCIAAGCIERQSKWMRGKKIAAHTGFWIVEYLVHKRGIGRIRAEWFPLYV